MAMVESHDGETVHAAAWSRRRISISVVAAAVLVGVAVIGVVRVVVGGGGGGFDEVQLDRATVSIEMEQSISGPKGCSFTVAGSGSVVDADEGLVLTNAHVVKPSAEGLGREVVCNGAYLRPDPERIQLSVSPGDHLPTQPAYYASVVAWDGYLDLAVLRIDSTIGGQPIEDGDYEALGLVEIGLGSSDEVKTGDEVNVVGFPWEVGSDSATLTTGVVSGVDGDAEFDTSRALFIVDARIRKGNSGGPAADDNGRQIGVSTFIVNRTYGGVRPIELARPLIAAAEKGEEYQSPYAGGAALTGYAAGP